MYEVHIVPEDKILNIKADSLEQAQTITRQYYPFARFVQYISDDQIAIMDDHLHVGNIWKV